MYPGDDKCAELSIKLLLGLSNEEDLKHWQSMEWPRFLKLAKKNVITIRMYDKLNDCGIRINNEEYVAAVQAERTRIKNALESISRIGRAFSEAGIKCVFIKSFQHFPDMGDDIDLLVTDYSPVIDDILRRELNARLLPKTLLQRLSVESVYGFENCATSVELHHGRLGLAGEHRSYAGLIIKNLRTVTVEGTDVPIPSPEDQLLNQTLHRLYGHFYFRISDVVGSALSLCSGELDLSYVTAVAKEIGILKGLEAYCGAIDRIYQDTVGRPLPRPASDTAMVFAPTAVSFHRSYFRYPMLPLTSKLYLCKLVDDLVAGRWSSIGRTGLIPLVASWRLGANLLGRRSRFFE